MDPDKRPTFNEIVETLSTVIVNDEATPTNDTSKRLLVSSQSEPILSLSKVEESAEEEIKELNEEETDSSYEFSHHHPSTVTTSSHSGDLEDTLSSLLHGTRIEEKEKNSLLIKEGLSLLSDDQDHQCGDSGIDPDYYVRSLSSQRSYSDSNWTDTRSSPSSSLRLERYHSPLVSSTNGGNHCRETSDSSEISFHLPSPSYAWAPPSSPIPQHNQQRKSASFSFPSSPMSPKKLYNIADKNTMPSSSSNSTTQLTDILPTDSEMTGILGEQQLLFDSQSSYIFGCKNSIAPSLINHSPSISTPNLQSV